MTIVIVPADDNNQRLDRWLKNNFPDLPFGQAQKLIRTGQIRINGGRVKPDSRLNTGDELRLPPSLSHAQSSSDHHKKFNQADRDFIRSITLYEDSDLIALNKPPGLAVQGGSKTKRHIDGMVGSIARKGVKPRLVHRLDKDTSGVLILAKSAEVARHITRAFQEHDIRKTYWALTCPAPRDSRGTINAPIGKAPVRRDGGEMMMFDPTHGKKAVTDFEILDSAARRCAFVAFYPKTGRTHQIRVHAAMIGAPLLGDQKYNPNPFPEEFTHIYKGLHLHARMIELKHPVTGRLLNIQAPLPDEFLKSWKYFSLHV